MNRQPIVTEGNPQMDTNRFRAVKPPSGGLPPSCGNSRQRPGILVRNVCRGLLVLLAATGPVLAQEPLTLRDMGMFFVGGEVRETAGFEQHVDQALVHYLIPVNDRDWGPVVMYPGLGLSSYIYLSTPDGREGWAQAFARRGFSAYVYDPVNTGPSGFAVGPFRSADQPAPGVSTWNIGQVWQRWGFGDAPGEPYGDTRFPVEHVEQFYASWPPRVGGGGGGMGGGGGGMGAGAMAAAGGGGGMGAAAQGGGLPPTETDNPNVLALEALLERTGPAVLMPHSAGGPVIFVTARRRPELVTAIVVLEPTGCPTNPEAVEPITHIPFLAVYGDYIESRNQTGRLEACRATAAMITEMGGRGDMLELTEEGIRGNSHLFMQDDNSDDIAARVAEWLMEIQSDDDWD